MTGPQTGNDRAISASHHGVADAANTLVTSLLDPTTWRGVIQAENSLNSQITDAQTQITQLQAQVTAYTAYLTQIFSAMETRVSELQSQGGAFAAATGTSSSSGTKTTA